jgi:hypothetical protein
MKAARVLALLGALAITARADDTLTFETIEGHQYKNVTLSRVEPSGIQVLTDDGIDRVPFRSLPPDLQKRFGFDPQTAAKYEAAMAQASHQRTLAIAAATALRTVRENQAAEEQNKKGSLLSAGAERFKGQKDLPWPIEGHTFTMAEVLQYRKDLLGEVVKLSLTATPDDNEQQDDGTIRVFASDTRSNTDAFVDFPSSAASKLRVMESSPGGLTFYVRIDEHQLTAVGRSRNIDSFHRTFTYTW